MDGRLPAPLPSSQTRLNREQEAAKRRGKEEKSINDIDEYPSSIDSGRELRRENDRECDGKDCIT